MSAASRQPTIANAAQAPATLPPHAPLNEFYASPAARAGFVTRLFDRTASSYDRISSLIAFGSDRRYRREALSRAGVRPGLRLLDLATGTGLVLDAALELGLPPADLTGLDPSRGMLNENRKRHRVALVQGIGERLPFADASFDFVSMGYALRHVADLHAFFSELRRVLKPQGRLLILEITRPASPLGRGVMRLHLRKVVPWIGRWLTGEPDVARLMEYYHATIEQCVPGATVLAALSKAGFTEVRQQTCWRILSDYRARRA